MRTPRAVDAALQQSGLPDDAVEVIRRLVTRSRLWQSERMDVLEEMVSHFHDGLDAGVSLPDLIAGFGDPDETAPMIRTAKRRQRPPSWRAAFATLQVVALIVASAVTIYGSRAAALYLRAPESGVASTQMAIEPIAVQTGDEWSVEVYDDAVIVLEENAIAAAQVADASRFVDEVEAMFSVAREHRSRTTVAGDLIAARIELRAAALVSEAPFDFNAHERTRLAAQLSAPTELNGVRVAFASLLDNMYTSDTGGDGQLTGTGIELLRQVKGWHEPTQTDKLMEPLWYLFPASRSEVAERFETVVCAAENCASGPTAIPLLEPIAKSMWECLRFPAISAVLPQLAEVLYANENATRARNSALASLKS